MTAEHAETSNRCWAKAAIANAKLAYEYFKQAFAGERWAKLAAMGAKPQRLLWASTSTKNKSYPDTIYIDALIGRDTVNTIPLETLSAFSRSRPPGRHSGGGRGRSARSARASGKPSTCRSRG